MRHIKTWIFLCLWVVSGGLFGCGDTQAKQLLNSYEAVSMAMRMNMEDPEAVLSALDKCIEKYGPLWEASRQSTRSPEALDREMSQFDAEMREVIIELLDLDLEFQDRFRDNPEVIQAYMTRLERIGLGE